LKTEQIGIDENVIYNV